MIFRLGFLNFCARIADRSSTVFGRLEICRQKSPVEKDAVVGLLMQFKERKEEGRWRGSTVR
jgi:hypothetical protein